MPDWTFYMGIAEKYSIPPWQVEKELTLEWFQRLQVWNDEQPKRK